MVEDAIMIPSGPHAEREGTMLAWTHAFPDVYVTADQILR